MTSSEKLTTTVSTNGQVTLPSARSETAGLGRWYAPPGRRHAAGRSSETAAGFCPDAAGGGVGILPHSGVPKTLQDMDASVLDEAQRRHARD
jgi:hypothetical protein